ncbi:FecR family protein [Chryseobacterium lactis]|nr:FecR domain-containing protein [Chryseobacterium lactis]
MKRLTYKNIEAFVFRLWTREVSGEKISEKENEILENWRTGIERDLDPIHMKESKERILSALEHYFIASEKRNHISSFRKYAYKAAAIVLLLLSLGSWFTYSTFFKPDMYVAKSEKQVIKLADGSVVTLLPGAELTVAQSFPASTRVVDLKGNAIFSVAKSKIHPFIVNAEGFSTKVLGTVFKISQSGQKKAVDLYEGKVAVSSAGVPVSYLKPHQQWTNFGVAHTTAIISMGKTTGNRTPELLSLSFNDVPLKEVITVLEANYHAKIYYPKETEDRKITADFTGGKVAENIESLAFILGLEVERKENTYILKK